MIAISKNQQMFEKKVAPIFLSNGISSTLIIPIEMARRYHLDRPCHVVLEEKEDGIFIKRLDLESLK
jgi:hypothetical protein